VFRRVELFEWDDRNVEHLARHAVSVADIEQLTGNSNIIVRNFRTGVDRFYLIGHTNGRRCLTVSIEATDDPGVWRPITAHDSSAREIRALRRSTR
jgi:uncharacterized DUF497 family protein